MNTLKYIQYALGAAALALMITGEVLGWSLSGPVMAALGTLLGWMTAKRPTELAGSPE